MANPLANHGCVDDVENENGDKRCTSGTQCYAYNCFNYNNADTKRRGISFHRFPCLDVEPDRWAAWYENCMRDTIPGKAALLCSEHFEKKLIRPGKCTRLSPNAVPTIFDLPEHLKPRIVKPKQCTPRVTNNSKRVVREALELCIPEVQPKRRTFQVTRNSSRVLEEESEMPVSQRTSQVANNPEEIVEDVTEWAIEDHGYSATKDGLMKRVEHMKMEIRELKRQCKNSNAREMRAKEKLNENLEIMKEKDQLIEELEEKLAAYKRNNTQSKRQFASTLHCYSADAYEFLRKYLPLPSARSLRRWVGPKRKDEPDSSASLPTDSQEMTSSLFSIPFEDVIDGAIMQICEDQHNPDADTELTENSVIAYVSPLNDTTGIST